MLTPEEAKARLAPSGIADPDRRFAAEVGRLSGDARALGEDLLARLARNRLWVWEDATTAVQGVGARIDALDALDAAQRRALFQALLPDLADDALAAWDALRSYPYQIGAMRRMFRAPRHPAVSAAMRVLWLIRLHLATRAWRGDVVWLATWAGHLPSWEIADCGGSLLATVIDHGGRTGEAVLQILLASAAGTHEIAVFGRHVVRALLCASRPEGWEAIEQLLLRAQREEGLRQVILETIDEAHPEAFRRMLALVAEHRLARFSAVARAVDVWFGFAWDSEQVRRIDGIARRVVAGLTDRDARRAQIARADAEPEDLYLALWCEGQEDAWAVVERAQPLLSHARVAVRYVATHFLQQLTHAHANWALYEALPDADLRVVDRALRGFVDDAACSPPRPDLFERIEGLIERWPRKTTTAEAIVWPWCAHELDQSRIARALLTTIADRPLARLAGRIGMMDVRTRVDLCQRIQAAGAVTGDVRTMLVELLGDASPEVRAKAFGVFAGSAVGPQDAAALEALLARKADDLRRAVVEQLLRLSDADLRASIERLLAARSAPQRAGAVELLRRLVEADRCAAWARERAAGLAETPAHGVARTQVAAITSTVPAKATLDDALGLSPPDQRTPIPALVDRGVTLVSAASARLLSALDALVQQHAQRTCTVRYPKGDHATEVVLGELRTWGLHRAGGDRVASLAAMPLREVFEPFWRDRDQNLRDDDGLEIPRALALLRSGLGARSGIAAGIGRLLGRISEPKVAYPDVVELYLDWFLFLELPAGTIDFALDGLETILARLSDADWALVPSDWSRPKTEGPALLARRFLSLVSDLHDEWRAAWTDAQRVRHWQIMRAHHERLPKQRRTLGLWLDAHAAGAATDADLMALLLRPLHSVVTPTYVSHDSHHELREVSGHSPARGAAISPRVRELVARVRDRVLAIEIARGETPTAASAPSAVLRWTGGLDVLARVSAALTGASLRRGVAIWSSTEQGREASLSRILQRTRPADGETPHTFADRLPVASTGENRLLEIAMFAPQWSAHVEHALGWPGLAEAVWWMHAHTKDSKWSVEQELRDLWAAQTAERTPLSAQDLLDGAVDVAWFSRVGAALGDERLSKLLDLAKYASSGSGHTRARLFATTLLGTTPRAELLAAVATRRHQDSVRALGLLPLAGGAARGPDLLERYLAIQEFVRGTKAFGSQRQASEKRAAAIGLDNLARTAGYADPARLEWAMERAALGDLAAGAIHASAGDVEVTLQLDAEGEAQVAARKKGKLLKAVPPAARKDDAVKALLARAAAIDAQRKRMRASLEAAMIRGDAFTGAELAELMEHPVLAPQLQRLVLVGADLAGYPRERGRVLLGHDGTTVLVAPDARLRFAHPHDLLLGGRWSEWQRDCLRREVVQPFKQVFRELYVLTTAEKEERLRSRRYAGHQLQPRQAMAVLGSRGWVWHAEEGIRKVDHAAGIAAWLELQYAPYTPAEVEGVTIESVAFTRRGEWDVLPLETIPPRLLSETLRDVDLVVGVANRSGVDPEASASSLEARASLVRETCALLGLTNVRIESRHVLIDGKLARYSVHLGSATVHQLPGGHLCIIAVHAQHRGRVFLPFADDDPRTAEIVAKVLLLARDDRIKDPTILEQLRR